MSETDDESPAVDLETGPAVEGEPLARVASRLTWPATRSEVETQEGDATIRTPDGPMSLADAFETVDVPLFESRSEFRAAVEDAVGTGPVPTE